MFTLTLQTASGVAFIFYLLAKNPDKQDKLRSEVLTILPEKDSRLVSENMKNLPYLRAVIKESFRMLPVAGGNARRVMKDVVLGGYHVPKGTLVVMSAYNEMSNPKFYPEPEKFIPERWLRNDQDGACWRSKESNPFAYLPFGFGAR
jgi:cytochrome P450 family 12